MKTDEISVKILEAYSNPTKMKIIFLLSDEREMTVTQMASNIDVGRSNLYHFVQQMVEDKILCEPVVRPKKNYVEKYYKLNTEMFGISHIKSLYKEFEGFSADQAKSIISSVLTGAGTYLLLLAKKVIEMDDETLEKIGQAFLKKNMVLQYTSTHIGAHPVAEEYLRKAAKEFSKPSKNGDKKESLKTLIVSIPFI